MYDSKLELSYSYVWNVDVSVSIACAMQIVAFVGVIFTGRGSPYMAQHFRCMKYTGGRRSFEAATMKKSDLWLV